MVGSRGVLDLLITQLELAPALLQYASGLSLESRMLARMIEWPEGADYYVADLQRGSSFCGRLEALRPSLRAVV